MPWSAVSVNSSHAVHGATVGTIASMCTLPSICTPLSAREPVLRFRAISFELGGPKCRIGVRHGARLATGHGGLARATVQAAGVIPFIPRHRIHVNGSD